MYLKFLVDIDDCDPDQCENGATCNDGVDSYTCDCVSGYTGNNCETSKCKILSKWNSTSLRVVEDYGKKLKKKLQRRMVEANVWCFVWPLEDHVDCNVFDILVDIDDCTPDPCQNGGTCTDGVASYTCGCVNGYDGTDCENSKCKLFFKISNGVTS